MITYCRGEHKPKCKNMKKLLQGLQCGSNMLISCNLLLCFLVLSNSVVSYAKSLDHHENHLRKRNVGEPPSCDLVQHFFESMNVTVNNPLANDKSNGEWVPFNSQLSSPTPSPPPFPPLHFPLSGRLFVLLSHFFVCFFFVVVVVVLLAFLVYL